jgi:hypothetical protein
MIVVVDEVLSDLFEKYCRDALELVGRDRQQAVKILWNAIASLIKLHASSRGVFIVVWDHLEFYDEFYNLLVIGEVLYKYSYEGGLDEETFKIFWTRALDLLNKVKQLVM